MLFFSSIYLLQKSNQVTSVCINSFIIWSVIKKNIYEDDTLPTTTAKKTLQKFNLLN